MEKKHEIKDLYYYLTTFKLEGHETWRAHLAKDPDQFERESSSNNWPKTTEKHVMKFDRLKGTFIQ